MMDLSYEQAMRQLQETLLCEDVPVVAHEASEDAFVVAGFAVKRILPPVLRSIQAAHPAFDRFERLAKALEDAQPTVEHVAETQEVLRGLTRETHYAWQDAVDYAAFRSEFLVPDEENESTTAQCVQAVPQTLQLYQAAQCVRGAFRLAAYTLWHVPEYAPQYAAGAVVLTRRAILHAAGAVPQDNYALQWRKQWEQAFVVERCATCASVLSSEYKCPKGCARQ